MLQLVWSWPVTALVDVAAIAVLHAVPGYLAHRLHPRRLERDGRLLAERAFEDGGRWYRRLGIDRWKDRLPEAGDLFPGGVSKRALRPGDDGLQVLVRETRRAELTHWWGLAGGAVFVLWNPPVAAALLVAYAVLVNAPFIAIQRYNRFRAVRVLERRSARAHERA